RANNNVSGLLVFDGNEKTRAALVMKKEGPTFNLIDEKEKGRLILSMSNTHSGLLMHDESGKLRLGLDAAPSMIFFDSNENPRAAFVVKKNGPIINLFDKMR